MTPNMTHRTSFFAQAISALLLAWLCFLSPGAHATEKSRTYLILQGEKHHWTVEQIRERPSQLPRLISRKSFHSQAEAEAYAAQLTDTLETEPFTALLPSPSAGLLTEVPGEAIWKTREQWNWEWEKRYAEWVRNSVGADFMERYQIPTDCADVAYVIRWIFARIHGLPAANRLSGSGVLFTNESMLKDWANLPTAEQWNDDPRFRAALNYLMDLTYTHTLLSDSYPIAIRQEALLEGTHHLQIHRATGHTLLVNRTDLQDSATEPIRVICSTVPQLVRPLMESGFWVQEAPKEGQGGFLKMLWPQIDGNGNWRLASPEEMPFYSLEQYSSEFMRDKATFAEAVLSRLNPKFDYSGRLREGIHHLIDQLKTRKEVVDQGYAVCQGNRCPADSKEYDDWSTPSRDLRLLELIEQIETLVTSPQGRISRIADIWESAQRNEKLSLDGADSTTTPLGVLIAAWKHHTFSSDPNQPPSVRWGVDPSSYTSALTRALNAGLSQRRSLMALQMGASCEPGSELWKKWNTFAIDREIQNIASATVDYCHFASDEQCASLKQLFASTSVASPPLTLSLAQWQEQSLWLNSDPRAPISDRWGAQKLFYRSTFVPAGQLIQVSRAGLAKIGNRLQNVDTGTEIEDARSFSRFGIDPFSDYWYGIRQDNVTLSLFRKSQSLGPDQKRNPQSAKPPFWILPGVLASEQVMPTSEATLDLIDLNSPSLPKTSDVPAIFGWTYPNALTSFLPSGAWLGMSHHQLEWIDIRDSSLKRTPVLWDRPLKGLVGGQTMWKEGNRMGLLVLECSDAGCGQGMGFLGTVILDTLSGRIIKRFDPHTFVYLYPGGHQALLQVDGRCSWVDIDEQFNISNPKPLGIQIVQFSSEFFEAKDERGVSHYFRGIKDNGNVVGIEEFALLDDEAHVSSARGPWVITQLTDNRGFRLRKFGDPQTHYFLGPEGTLSLIGNDLQSGIWLHVRFDRTQPEAALFDPDTPTLPVLTYSVNVTAPDAGLVFTPAGTQTETDIFSRGYAVPSAHGARLWVEKRGGQPEFPGRR